MVKLNSGFYMVRCADKATSDKVKSDAISTMIFLDGDGKEFHRTIVGTADTVEAAFKKASELYSKKPISWASGEASDVISGAKGEAKKLVALAFLDEKKDSETFLSSLEDRWVAKYHERMVFTKVAFDRNSELCKKYNVTSAPTLLLVNPLQEDAKKSVVDSLVSKKELLSVRNFLAKAFDKFDKASKN
ncbi:MAG TPA: thioredoxin domain-containing protein [Planctomycetota bacterium]|nr:thioredoxin domain-containing protein [Planctomycetota bacterium]